MTISLLKESISRNFDKKRGARVRDVTCQVRKARATKVFHIFKNKFCFCK